MPAAHAVNTRLASLRTIALGGEAGPEHVAIGPDGKLYAAVASGTILRMDPDGTGVEAWARTDGRVLGFDFDARGRLIAADAIRGLLAIDTDRRVEVLVDKIRVGDTDDPVRYANSVVVARNGLIYFSDATRRFGARDWGGTFEASVLDILEHSSTGRVIEYDPASGRAHVVIERLCFANGVALSADERSLFVAETGEYRVWKVDVDASEVDAKNAAGGHTKARLVACRTCRAFRQPHARQVRAPLAGLRQAARRDRGRDVRPALAAPGHAAAAARAVAGAAHVRGT